METTAGHLIGGLIGGLVIIGILTRILNWILDKNDIPKKKSFIISAISCALFSIIAKAFVAEFEWYEVGKGIVFYSIAALLWLVYDLKKTSNKPPLNSITG
jgi:hypothetical protein